MGGAGQVQGHLGQIEGAPHRLQPVETERGPSVSRVELAPVAGQAHGAGRPSSESGSA